MTTEALPKCKLCGATPTLRPDGLTYRHSDLCPASAVYTEDQWRRLHGPLLAPETLRRLRDIAELMDQCGAFSDSHGEQQDHVDDAAAIRAALAALVEGKP